MKLFAAILCLLVSSTVFGHDWRKDRAAFEYTRRALLNPKAEPPPLPRESFQKFEIDPAFLKEKLSQLSGALAISIEGKSVVIRERKSPAGRELARAFLAGEFSALGFTVNTHDYATGKNFVAERAGSDPTRVLILSAHIDSVGNAGANDDGMGTVAALAVAKALTNQSLRYTLRFVGFDEEEKGLIGSKQYVRMLRTLNETLLGDIQVEMMGTNSRGDGAFHVIDCDRSDSKFMSEKIMGAIAANGIPLKRIPACTRASDHAAFWSASLPAVVLSENFFGGDGDKCYHAKCDVVDSRMNFQYAARIAGAIASAVANIVEASSN
jgi:Zn-dependent M28 family amino/carboxypeptidase